MTDARLPERWLNDRRLRRLPDDAFRLFVTSLMWSVANRTDGVLTEDDLALIPGGENRGAIWILTDVGLWTSRSYEQGHYWLILDYDATQTTREQLEAAAEARRKARDKKRRQRAALSAVPRDVPRDNTRPGQDRPGQAPRDVVPGIERADEVDSRRRPRQLAAEAHGGSGGNGDVPPSTVINGSGLATPSQSLRDHDGPEPDGPDAQHFSIEVHAGAQPQTVTRGRGRP